MKFFLLFVFIFSGVVSASFEALIEQTSLEEDISLIFPKKLTTNTIISGRTFEFDLKNSQIYGDKNIKVSYGNMITTSDKISYDIISKKIQAQGNVLFLRDNMKLRSQKARLSVPFDIEALGKVELNYKYYSSSSDYAQYIFKSREIIFENNVRFKDSETNDLFKSNKIIFNFKTEEILSVGRSRAKINTQRLPQ